MTTLVRTADPNKLIHVQVVQQGPTTEHVWVQVALLCVSSGALHFHVFYVKNSRCPISRQALARKGPSIEGCRRCWTSAGFWLKHTPVVHRPSTASILDMHLRRHFHNPVSNSAMRHRIPSAASKFCLEESVGPLRNSSSLLMSIRKKDSPQTTD